jgi:hypothetical protein
MTSCATRAKGETSERAREPLQPFQQAVKARLVPTSFLFWLRSSLRSLVSRLIVSLCS